IPPAKLHAVLANQTADTTPAAKPAEDKPAEAAQVRFKYEVRPNTGNTNPAEFHYQLAPTKSSGGKRVKFSITMKLDQTWHTFPPNFEGEGGSPTNIKLTKLNGLKPIDEEFKPNREPELKEEDGLRLQIYHDQVTWIREFEVLPDTPLNAFGVEG